MLSVHILESKSCLQGMCLLENFEYALVTTDLVLCYVTKCGYATKGGWMVVYYRVGVALACNVFYKDENFLLIFKHQCTYFKKTDY